MERLDCERRDAERMPARSSLLLAFVALTTIGVPKAAGQQGADFLARRNLAPVAVKGLEVPRSAVKRFDPQQYTRDSTSTGTVLARYTEEDAALCRLAGLRELSTAAQSAVSYGAREWTIQVRCGSYTVAVEADFSVPSDRPSWRLVETDAAGDTIFSGEFHAMSSGDGGLVVESYRLTGTQLNRRVEGTLTNTTNRRYSFVQVEFNIVNASERVVGSAIDNIRNLGPGRTWKFQAPVTSRGSKAQLERIVGKP